MIGSSCLALLDLCMRNGTHTHTHTHTHPSGRVRYLACTACLPAAPHVSHNLAALAETGTSQLYGMQDLGQASVLLDEPVLETQTRVDFPAHAGDRLELAVESVDVPNGAVVFRAAKIIEQWVPPGAGEQTQQQVAVYA